MATRSASYRPTVANWRITEGDAAGTNTRTNTDIRLIDLDRGVPTRFTIDAGDETNPVWSPDGTTIVFRSTRKGPGDLYKKAQGGAVAEQLLYESPEDKVPSGFSPDRKLLLFSQGRFPTYSVWALPLAGDPKPFQVFADSSAAESLAVFSPDGRWIAYVSGADQGPNVYVQPYPPTGNKIRISTTTGTWPKWTADGKRICT